MTTPAGGVADLIMQLMARGQSGGLPMQASPELVQYLAHAQGGTAPPQIRGMPSADVLQGPGSGAAAVSQPFDFESLPMSADAAPPTAMDMVTDMPSAPSGDYQSIKRHLAQLDSAELESILNQYGRRTNPGFPPQSSVIDDVARQIAAEQSGRPPSRMFRQPEEAGSFNPGETFIWYTRGDGKRIKLDGPFSDDISAGRAMKELREAGMTGDLELSPY